MKKYNLFNIATKLFGMSVVMAVLAALSTLYIAGLTMALVGAVVTGGTDGSGAVTMEKVKDGSPDLDVNYISKKVCEMRPAATPLDTIMRNISNQQAIKSFVSEYYAVESRPFYDTVNTRIQKTGDGHTSHDLVVNNISMWSKDDTLMVNGITGSDGMDLVFRCFQECICKYN